jgi:hypothetical protein
LNAFQLTPSELSPSSPLHVPGGDDSRRAEMIEIVKQLDELGLSQFVPDPRAAIAAELGRREKALDKAEAPDPRRISIMLRGQADLRGL